MVRATLSMQIMLLTAAVPNHLYREIVFSNIYICAPHVDFDLGSFVFIFLIYIV